MSPWLSARFQINFPWPQKPETFSVKLRTNYSFQIVVFFILWFLEVNMVLTWNFYKNNSLISLLPKLCNLLKSRNSPSDEKASKFEHNRDFILFGGASLKLYMKLNKQLLSSSFFHSIKRTHWTLPIVLLNLDQDGKTGQSH